MIDIVAEQSPLGGLERWLGDPAVSEVLVNGGGQVWVERGGRLQSVGAMRPATLLAAIEHMLVPVGRRLDRSNPAVDARLADGSRLCAAIPPIAVDGPCLCIRRFAAQPIPVTGFADPEVAPVLAELVRRRCNVVVSGGTSSGKTTLLNALAQGVPGHERIITLEDVAELRLVHPHVVRLETRDATPDGVAAVTLAHLLRTALRMRPDRLVVGEVRGEEAVDLLHALNTGHDGSLCTVHANSAFDALQRLSALVIRHTSAWPLVAVQHHVARAVDAVAHLERGSDGRRRLTEVVELMPPSEDRQHIAVRHLVADGRMVGKLTRGRT